MVPCFAQERQAGGLPLLPAVGEVMWSSPLSCLHTPWLLGLVWEVLICIQEAGLFQKVTDEQMPMLVENDAYSLHVLQHLLAITHPQICCPLVA